MTSALIACNRSLVESEKFSIAIPIFRRVAREHPHLSLEAYRNLGHSLQMVDQPHKAVGAYRPWKRKGRPAEFQLHGLLELTTYKERAKAAEADDILRTCEDLTSRLRQLPDSEQAVLVTLYGLDLERCSDACAASKRRNSACISGPQPAARARSRTCGCAREFERDHRAVRTSPCDRDPGAGAGVFLCRGCF